MSAVLLKHPFDFYLIPGKLEHLYLHYDSSKKYCTKYCTYISFPQIRQCPTDDALTGIRIPMISIPATSTGTRENLQYSKNHDLLLSLYIGHRTRMMSRANHILQQTHVRATLDNIAHKAGRRYSTDYSPAF